MSDEWYVNYTSESHDDGQTIVQCLSVGTHEDDDGDAFAFSEEFYGRHGIPDDVERKFQLIAAAPDLLDACEYVRRFLAEYDTGRELHPSLYQKLDAAIAKAKQ